jgi:hypothetical protein
VQNSPLTSPLPPWAPRRRCPRSSAGARARASRAPALAQRLRRAARGAGGSVPRARWEAGRIRAGRDREGGCEEVRERALELRRARHQLLPAPRAPRPSATAPPPRTAARPPRPPPPPPGAGRGGRGGAGGREGARLEFGLLLRCHLRRLVRHPQRRGRRTAAYRGSQRARAERRHRARRKCVGRGAKDGDGGGGGGGEGSSGETDHLSARRPRQKQPHPRHARWGASRGAPRGAPHPPALHHPPKYRPCTARFAHCTSASLAARCLGPLGSANSWRAGTLCAPRHACPRARTPPQGGGHRPTSTTGWIDPPAQASTF